MAYCSRPSGQVVVLYQPFAVPSYTVSNSRTMPSKLMTNCSTTMELLQKIQWNVCHQMAC